MNERSLDIVAMDLAARQNKIILRNFLNLFEIEKKII